MRPAALLLLGTALGMAMLLAACDPRDRSGPGLYAGYCARCHGQPGEGPKRRSQLYPHTDLRTSPMLLRGDRAAVRQRIAKGHGPMPGFSRRLTREELDRLVDFTLGMTRGK